MKIIFFTDHFIPEPSAPAAHIFDRSRLWVSQGHEVTIVTSAPNAPEGRVHDGYSNSWRSIESLDGLRVVRVKTFIAPNASRTIVRFLDYLSYCASATIQALREPRPDVVISSSPHIFVALAGTLYALIKRVPHVFEVRDLWPATITAVADVKEGVVIRLLEKLELWMYRRARRVLLFTRSFYDDLTSRGIPGSKLDVVYNGADLDLFAPSTEKDEALVRELGLEHKFVVGFIGTLGLAQDLLQVLRAARQMQDTAVHFLFVGAGAELDKLKDYCAQERLNNVTFVPRQLKAEVPRYWSVCDASLVHLKNEPVLATAIPSKIFESMAVGLPIIFVAPRGSEGAEIVAQTDTGIVVEAGDPQRLAAQITDLARDPARRERFSRNGERTAPRFSRNAQADATLAVLQRAIDV